MALIKCPECRKDISDMASSCPSCGYELKKKITDSKAKNNIVFIGGVFIVWRLYV